MLILASASSRVIFFSGFGAGYLDDEKYCQRLIEYLLEVKKFSTANIKQECFKRGINREIVDEKLSIIEIDNISTIIKLIKSKYATKLNQ